MRESDWQFVRRLVSLDEILDRPWCDRIEALGSFWVDDPPRDAASQLAKFLKEGAGRPEWPAVAAGYVELAAVRLSGMELDGITRVLSAEEAEPDPQHPLERLCSMVARRLGLPPPFHPIRRRAARLPMRQVDSLSGPDRLRERIDFVLTDLQVQPGTGPRNVLLLDDILCLGASMRVYAAALKTSCGAKRVTGMNIAATRFRGGKDGWDDLRPDLDTLLQVARSHKGPAPDAFDPVWVSPRDNSYHADPACRRFVSGDDSRSLRFLAAHRHLPCPACVLHPPATTRGGQQALRSIWARIANLLGRSPTDGSR